MEFLVYSSSRNIKKIHMEFLVRNSLEHTGFVPLSPFVTMKRGAATVVEGARVEVRFDEPPQWFGGTVVAVSGLSSYDFRS